MYNYNQYNQQTSKQQEKQSALIKSQTQQTVFYLFWIHIYGVYLIS